MANIVGLGQVQDDPAGARRRLDPSLPMQDGEKMRLPDLQPKASPVDFYHRPAQAPINNDLHSLAEGLSALNPALSRFASQMSKPKDEEIDKDALTAKFAPMQADELQQALKSDPVLQGKMAKQFAGNIYAEKVGLQDREALTQAYNDPEQFDKANGDFNTFAQNWVAKKTVERFGNDPAGAKFYQDAMVGNVHSLQQDHLKNKLESNDIARQQMTQDGYSNILRSAINTDLPPEKIVAQSAEFMKTNKLVMNMPPKKQMEMQLSALDGLLNDMDGSPDKRDKYYAAANAILTGTRKDENGVEHRLIDTPGGLGDMAKGKLAEFAKKRDALNDQARVVDKAQVEYTMRNEPQKMTTEQFMQWNKERGEVFSTGEAKSLILARQQELDKQAAKLADLDAENKAKAERNGVLDENYRKFKDGEGGIIRDVEVHKKEFYSVGDESAKQKVTADEQRQDITEKFHRDIQFLKNQKVNSKEWKPEEADEKAFGLEADRYSINGMVPKEWKEEMTYGARKLNSSAQSASKEMPQESLAAFKKYQILATNYPNLLSEVADGTARTIFETAMHAEGSDTEKLRGAIQYYANHTDETEKVAKKKVAEAIEKVGGQSWAEWGQSLFRDGHTVENLGALNDEVSKRAAYNIQAYKMNPETAVKKAAESVAKHAVRVNGWVIPGDQRLPPQADKLLENYTRGIVTQVGMQKAGKPVTTEEANRLGAQELNVSNYRDLTFITQKNGLLQLYNKSTGQPVLDPVPVPWAGENTDGRFVTPEMVFEMSQQDRQKHSIRALREGDERRAVVDQGTRQGKITGPVSQAVGQVAKQGLDATGRTIRDGAQYVRDNSKFEAGIYNANSKGRPEYKPTAPWLDLNDGPAFDLPKHLRENNPFPKLGIETGPKVRTNKPLIDLPEEIGKTPRHIPPFALNKNSQR